jgi:clan AA aspartic protease (TIGR02281 family)
MKKFVIFFFLTISCSFASGQLVIPKDPVQNVFKLECKVNGEAMIFIFDTGASGVSMSQKEFDELFKLGKIKTDDIIGKTKYTIANGAIEEGTKVNLKSIEIQGLTLKDIEATVIKNENAPLLLGISVISQLGKVIIQNDKIIIDINQEIKRKSEEEFKAEINALFNKPIKTLLLGLFNNKLSENYFIEYSKYFLIPDVDTTAADSDITKTTVEKENEINIRLLKEEVDEIKTYLKQKFNSGIEIDTASFELYFNNSEKRFLVHFIINNEPHSLVVNYNDKKEKIHIWKLDVGPRKAIDLYYKYQDLKNILHDYAMKEIEETRNSIFLTKNDDSRIATERRYEEFISTNEYSISKLNKSDLDWLANRSFRLERLYFEYGKVLFHNKKYSKSIYYLTNALNYINSATKYFLYDKNQILNYRSDAKSALNDYTGALADLKLLPESEYNYYNYRRRGDNKTLMNDNLGALQDYNKSINLNNKDCYGYLSRGMLKFKMKDIKGASSDWSKAGELGCEEAYDLIKNYYK